MNKIINIKVITLFAVFPLILLAAIGMTFAYHNNTTLSMTNTFSLGSVETQIIEDINGINKKDVTIKNIGKSDCYIRVRITINPSNAPVDLTDKASANSNWSLNSTDGFYYYAYPVAPNTSTNSLFKGYSIKNNEEFIPFEITVYQEAVQAAVYDETNNKHVYTMTEAWSVYDNGTRK